MRTQCVSVRSSRWPEAIGLSDSDTPSPITILHPSRSRLDKKKHLRLVKFILERHKTVIIYFIYYDIIVLIPFMSLRHNV